MVRWRLLLRVHRHYSICQLAIPAAIYALIMFATSAVFAWFVKQQSERIVESTSAKRVIEKIK